MKHTGSVHFGRRRIRCVRCGDVTIGGDAPVSVQSMTRTRTEDVGATLAQVGELAALGCQIIRCAVPSRKAAAALPRIVEGSSLPVVADIHFDHRLALAALEMALAARAVTPGGLVHHSDRGLQYACGDYVARLDAHGILASMSRTGCPWDNAMAESFMKTLKTEQVEGRAYRDLDHARGDIGGFIERVYNRQRLHSALAYLSPEEFEQVQPEPWAAVRRPMAPNETCP